MSEPALISCADATEVLREVLCTPSNLVAIERWQDGNCAEVEFLFTQNSMTTKIVVFEDAGDLDYVERIETADASGHCDYWCAKALQADPDNGWDNPLDRLTPEESRALFEILRSAPEQTSLPS